MFSRFMVHAGLSSGFYLSIDWVNDSTRPTGQLVPRRFSAQHGVGGRDGKVDFGLASGCLYT